VRAGVSLESHLANHAWEALVENGVNGLILQLEKPPLHGLQYLDKERSRSTILLRTRYPWPVALPQDEIQPFSADEGIGFHGFFYVDIETPKSAEEAFAILPLRGRGWHHVSCIHEALANGVLRLSEITHSFRPSASVAPDTFAAALARALQALPDEKVRLGDNTECNLCKTACNSLVGLWGRRDHHELRATCSQTAQDGDILGVTSGETWRRPVGVADWVDGFHKQELVRRHTFSLMHRAVLDQEAAALARILRKLPGKIYKLNTDSVLYAGNRVEEEGWRCELTQFHRLQGHRRLLVRNDAPPRLEPAFTDLTEEAAEAHVLAGGSLRVEAMAAPVRRASCAKSLPNSRRRARRCSCAPRPTWPPPIFHRKPRRWHGCFTAMVTESRLASMCSS